MRRQGGRWFRRIRTIHLSRPENYLSIYQSGCNLSCRKCHSWEFSRFAVGEWYAPEDIARAAARYASLVTLKEPRHRATAWHAHDTCHCCGSCVTTGMRPGSCPRVLESGKVVPSPQGWGPARNIVGFTGGDLTCRQQFYVECARIIKERTGDLWVLIETNGYGLSPENLVRLREGGVDAFWLDIKAFDDRTHRWLTGGTNGHILSLPAEILSQGFVLEVLSLYIPGVVEWDQLRSIAHLLADVNTAIPFTILAFFPEYRMKRFRSPTAEEMLRAYEEARSAGLQSVRLGNAGVFIRSEEDLRVIRGRIPGDAL